MFRFTTPLGDIAITLLGHASLIIQWNEKYIFVDPYSNVADYSKQPKADLILLTHHHYDHLDEDALKEIVTDKSVFVTSLGCKESLPQANVLTPGESFTYNELKIEAVYAYNIINMREDGSPYHPRGEGNGYILNFGEYRVYIAGDSEITPEMREIKNIDIAFLPKNLPYTMSDQMFIEAAWALKPKNLFAYHFFNLELEYLKSKMPQGVVLRNS